MNPEELKGIDLFKGFTYDEAAAFLTFVAQREVSAGADIVKEHETGSDLFIVLSGTVQVIRPTRKGDEKVYATLGRGAVVGEIGLFLSLERTATVRAAEPTSLLVLDKDAETRFEAEQPVAALKLVRNILGSEIRRFMEAFSQVEKASFWI